MKYLRMILLSVVLVLGTRADLFADWADSDVGSPAASGSWSYDAGTDVHTVSGAGTGLINNADKFNFLSQQTSGDIEITAKVESFDNTAAAAADSADAVYSQAGVTIRDNTDDAGAVNATLYVSAQDGLNFTMRDETGGVTTETLGPWDQTAPIWLRITKTGNIVSGYMSSDGNTWTLVATDTLDFAPVFYAGMVVSSAVDGTAATATFSNVTLVTNLPSAISGLNLWLRADQGVSATTVSGTDYVDDWMDQSGVGNDAVPVDSSTNAIIHQAHQAQLIGSVSDLNGMPALQFNPSGGGSDGPILQIQNSPSLKPPQFTIFVVGKYSSGGQANAPFVVSGTGSGGYDLSQNGNNVNVGTYVNSAASHFVKLAWAQNTYGLFQSRYDLQNISFSVNGGTASTQAYTGAITYDTSLFSIGGQANNPGSRQALAGDIAEILFYNRALSDAECTAVRAYLTEKYGSGLGAQPQVGEPTQAAGTPVSTIYSGGQKIEINPIDGAVIRYTTDGSEPNDLSTLYLGPIDVTGNTTYKFKAFRPGYTDSNTLTLTYKYDSSAAFTRNGLALWLRADSEFISVDGSGKMQWTDISNVSGTGCNASQSTTANQPAYTANIINGNGVVRFNGTSDVLNIADSALLKPSQLTVFVVGKYGVPTGNQVFLSRANSTLSNGYGVFGTTAIPGDAYGYINSSSLNKVGGGLAPSTNAVMTLRYDGTGVRTSINGTVFSNTYTTAISNPASTVLSLGSTSGATNFLQGDIAEVLLFNRALTDEERKEVEAYLYARYNISNTSPKVIDPQNSDLSVAPGLYNAPQNVSITVPADTTAKYTTDNSDPTTSLTALTYSSGTQIPISSTTTLKVVYIRSNYVNSDVISFGYTIDTGIPFIPTGIKMWLKADAGVTTSGTSVSGWADQSGNSHNAAQTTSADQPILISSIAGLNGNPAIRFDGSNDFLGVADHADLKPAQMTLFMVASYQAASGLKSFVVKGNNSLSNGYGFSRNGTTTSACINSSLATQTFAANTYGILSMTYDLQQIRASLTTGTNAPSVSTTAYTTPVSYDTNPLYIGSYAGTSRPMSCDIAEILLFDHALSDQQRVTVEKYLTDKYAIGVDPQLPAPTTDELSVPPGAYSNVQDINITVPDGLTARYTLDNTDPTDTSAEYTPGTPIHLNSTTNFLKIKYFEDGYATSDTLTAIYTLGVGGGGSPPTSGLMLWLRSDLGVISNNGLVSGWLDQSSHANHAGATGTQQPTLVTTGSTVINSLPVIHFDGKANLMGVADDATLKPSHLSAYVVGRYTTKTSKKLPFLLKVTNNFWNNGYGIYVQNGSDYGFINSYSNKVGGSVAPGAAGYFALTYDGSKMNALFNNSIFGSINYSTSLNNQTGAVLLLGADTFSFLNCDMAEVLLYDHALSDSERQDLQSYLYIRYLVGALPQVSAPVAGDLSLVQGNYEDAQATTITVPAGATAYYTLDGSDPTTSSSLYDGTPIAISGNKTLKVKFFKDGFLPSNTLTENYTIGTAPDFPNDGLQLWLRADKGVTSSSGTSVDTWDDQSGNGNQAVPNDPSNKPTVVTTGTTLINSQPVIHFVGSGSGQILKILDSPTLKPAQYTLFVVGKSGTAGSSTAPYVIKANSGATNGYGLAKSGNNIRAHVNGTYTASLAVGTGTSGIFTSSYDLQNINLSLSGATPTLTAYTAAISYETSAPFSPFSIGGDASGSGASLKPLDGDIAEVILFNRILTSNEMLQMQGYFYSRYALGSLPTTPNPTLPVSQIFTNTFTVTMGGGSLGTIYYTEDGSDPTSSSPVYSSASPPVLSETKTIKAKLFVSGWNDPGAAGIVTATYTKDDLPIPDGAVLRLRADTGVVPRVSGTTTFVTKWLDQSGNGLVASPPSGTANQPVVQSVTVSGTTTTSALVFDGETSNRSLSIPNTASLNPSSMTVYLVGEEQPINDGGNNYFFMKGSNLSTGGYGFAVEPHVDNTYNFYLNVAGGTNQVTTTLDSGTYFTAQMSYDFYQISLLKNGVPETPTPSSVSINSGTYPLQIGGAAAGAYALNGAIVELIIYNRALTIGEQIQVQQYMAGKYQFGASTGLPGGGLTYTPSGTFSGTDPHPEVAPNITLSLPSNAMEAPTPSPTP